MSPGKQSQLSFKVIDTQQHSEQLFRQAAADRAKKEQQAAVQKAAAYQFFLKNPKRFRLNPFSGQSCRTLSCFRCPVALHLHSILWYHSDLDVRF